jgi:hypothetical protein
MSHQVQLSPAASHCPTAVLDPARHAAEPPACRSRCPYSRPDMRRILSHLGNPSCTRIFHTSAKDSQTSPRTGRQDQSARSATIPPSVGCQARFPAKREATRGHRRAPAPHYIPGHPGSDLLARLMTVIDPRDTPELPAIDLPGTRAATRCRPAPWTRFSARTGGPGSEASSRSKDSLRQAFRCNAGGHERHCPAVRPRYR